MPAFDILTRGMPYRAEEWLLAQDTPESDLPRLTDEDRRRARIRHMTDEQYARHLVLRASTRKREEQEAEELGGTIVEILKELGGEFQLIGLWKRGLEPGWRAQIQFRPEDRGRVYDVPLPTEDFSGGPIHRILNISDPEEIRACLLAKLGFGEDKRMAS